MDKKTKLYIGIGLLGVGAYLYFRSTKNMVGLIKSCPPGMTMMNGRCVTNSTLTTRNASGKPIPTFLLPGQTRPKPSTSRMAEPPIKKPQPSPTFPNF